MTDTTDAGSVAGTEDAPASDVETTATAPAETQDATTEQPQTEPEGEQPEDEDKPKRQDWRDKRIAQLTARKAALEAEVSALAAKGQGREPASEDIDRIAQERAAQIVQQREALEAANRTAEKGAAEFKDWDQARTALIQNFGQEIQARPDFLEAVTSLDHGHAVFRHLGLNPDEADRVLSLTPAKMAVELAKLDTKLSAKPAAVVSKAPKPIKPIAASATPEVNPDKMTDAEWWAYERAQRAQKRR